MNLAELAKTIRRDGDEATKEIISQYGNMVYYNALAELGDESRALEVSKRVISDLLGSLREGEVPEDVPRHLQKQVRQQARNLEAEDAIINDLKAKIASNSSSFPAVKLAEEEGVPVAESAAKAEEPATKEAAPAVAAVAAPVAKAAEPAAEAPKAADPDAAKLAAKAVEAKPEASKSATLAPAVAAVAGAAAVGTLAATETKAADTTAQSTDRIPKLADAAEKAKLETEQAKTASFAPVAAAASADTKAADATKSAELTSQLDKVLPKTDPSATQPLQAVTDKDLTADASATKKPAPTAEELHRAFYGDEEEPRRTSAGFVVGIIIAVILTLLLIWLVVGFLGKLEIIPAIDLGYTWFNETVYHLF